MGKTVVVITHDDRYFSLADQVVKMEDGKMVAREYNAAMMLVRKGPETRTQSSVSTA
jgi:ABC-type siderophore export system fused ATPase/permease subunit